MLIIIPRLRWATELQSWWWDWTGGWAPWAGRVRGGCRPQWRTRLSRGRMWRLELWQSNIIMSSLVEVEDTAHTGHQVWTHHDPAIFRNEKVLRTLLKRELKTCPAGPSTKNYFLTTQTELKPGMRREVANWMLELCEEEGCSPQVFCLAINYLDRFLSACKIAR